jgi:hypothetical protein
MASHKLQPETASYIALGISIAALFMSTFLALSIDSIVDSSVTDAVIVTKVRISELDASVHLADARAEFSKNKNFTNLGTSVAEITTNLSAVYSAAPESDQERWLGYKAALDGIAKKATDRDLTVLADIDALVTSLKSDQPAA